MKQITLESINNYVKDRVPPGDFLYAVLTNNLQESFIRADEENRRDLEGIVAYCYHNIPLICWGSPEKVAKWLARRENEEKTDSE